MIDKKNRDEYTAIREEIKKDPQAKAYFNGHRPGSRISVAGLAFAGVLVSGGLIAGLALATLFAQLALLLLAMLAPVFLLAAVHPGAGRVIATRWANLVVYTAFKRLAYSVLLSVILVVNGALIDQGSKLGWGVAMTLSVALSGALFFYRKPFLSIIERVGSGGAASAPALTNAHGTSGRLARRAATGAAITTSVGGGTTTAGSSFKNAATTTTGAAGEAKAESASSSAAKTASTNDDTSAPPRKPNSFPDRAKHAGPPARAKTPRAISPATVARQFNPHRIARDATPHRDAVTDHFSTPPPDPGGNNGH